MEAADLGFKSAVIREAPLPPQTVFRRILTRILAGTGTIGQ